MPLFWNHLLWRLFPAERIFLWCTAQDFSIHHRYKDRGHIESWAAASFTGEETRIFSSTRCFVLVSMSVLLTTFLPIIRFKTIQTCLMCHRQMLRNGRHVWSNGRFLRHQAYICLMHRVVPVLKIWIVVRVYLTFNRVPAMILMRVALCWCFTRGGSINIKVPVVIDQE